MFRALRPLLLSVAGATLQAQTEPPPAFEVASVKPHILSGGFMRRPWSANIQCPPFHCGITGNRFSEEGASLADLMMDAYGVRRYQLAGLPSWGDSGQDVYDVVAKVEGEGTPTLAQVRRMLQTLLAERFQLKIHHETKELPVYALVTTKNPPKLARAAGPLCENLPGRGRSGGDVEGGRGRGGPPPNDPALPFLVAWERMPEFLSMWADRSVIDKTGFEGHYCTLDGQEPLFSLDVRQLAGGRGGGRGRGSVEPAPVPEAELGGVTIFSEVQQKWGLKLEPQKGPVDILVIDQVERPTAN